MRTEQLQGNQAADFQGSVRRLAGEHGWEDHLWSRRAVLGGGGVLRGHKCLTRHPVANLPGKRKVHPKSLRGVRPSAMCRASHPVPSHAADRGTVALSAL